MRERPILFSDAMVRAILNDNSPKTQTRRVLKTQPLCQGALKTTPGGELWYIWPVSEDGDRYCKCPYGIPGDRLWVRETWGLISPEEMSGDEWYGLAASRPWRLHPDSNHEDGVARAIYRADGEYSFAPGYTGWRPSIHMPRWASRITLEVTGVRAQRVRDISDEDICHELGAPVKWTGPDPEPYRRNLVQAFADLWDSINAKRGYGWGMNPWAWVVEFQRIAQ